MMRGVQTNAPSTFAANSFALQPSHNMQLRMAQHQLFANDPAMPMPAVPMPQQMQLSALSPLQSYQLAASSMSNMYGMLPTHLPQDSIQIVQQAAPEVSTKSVDSNTEQKAHTYTNPATLAQALFSTKNTSNESSTFVRHVDEALADHKQHIESQHNNVTEMKSGLVAHTSAIDALHKQATSVLQNLTRMRTQQGNFHEALMHHTDALNHVSDQQMAHTLSTYEQNEVIASMQASIEEIEQAMLVHSDIMQQQHDKLNSLNTLPAGEYTSVNASAMAPKSRNM